jgi:hypothetical protein
MLNYVKPERIPLKNNPYFNEAWVQQRIAEDPSLLGLSRHGQANNFVVMQPKKNWLRTNIRLDKSDEWDTQLEDSTLDFIGYSKSGRYRLRLTEGALDHESPLLEKMLKASYEQFGK